MSQWVESELRAEVVAFFGCWATSTRSQVIDTFVDELRVYPVKAVMTALERVKRNHQLTTAPPLGKILAAIPADDKSSRDVSGLDHCAGFIDVFGPAWSDDAKRESCRRDLEGLAKYLATWDRWAVIEHPDTRALLARFDIVPPTRPLVQQRTLA